MAKVPDNCPKELAPFIKDGLELEDVIFHNNVNPFPEDRLEPENHFHADSQKPSRRANIWLTRAGYFMERKGRWCHIPEAHGKIGVPLLMQEK